MQSDVALRRNLELFRTLRHFTYKKLYRILCKHTFNHFEQFHKVYVIRPVRLHYFSLVTKHIDVCRSFFKFFKGVLPARTLFAIAHL